MIQILILLLTQYALNLKMRLKTILRKEGNMRGLGRFRNSQQAFVQGVF